MARMMNSVEKYIEWKTDNRYSFKSCYHTTKNRIVYKRIFLFGLCFAKSFIIYF